MGEASVKATRRELRRAMGEQAVAAVGELQSNVSAITKSLALAHERLDAYVARLTKAEGKHVVLDSHVDKLVKATFRQRLNWLMRGRL